MEPLLDSWAIHPVRLGLSGRNSGKCPERPPETLSEVFQEFPSRVRLASPKPYHSRHLKPPERFQNCLLLSTAGDASFFRSGSGDDLSELRMEIPSNTEGISNGGGISTPRQLISKKSRPPSGNFRPNPPQASEKSLQELFQSQGWLEDWGWDKIGKTQPLQNC